MAVIVLVPIGVLLVVGALVLAGRDELPMAARVGAAIAATLVTGLATAIALVMVALGSCDAFGGRCVGDEASDDSARSALISLGGLALTLVVLVVGVSSVRRRSDSSADSRAPLP